MRHPHGLRAASGGTTAVQLGTIAWSTNNISTASISGVNFTATETTAPNNSSAQSTALPAVDATGWYLDWVQVEGYLAYINFVGVANSTANLAYGSTATTTSVYFPSLVDSSSGAAQRDGLHQAATAPGVWCC